MTKAHKNAEDQTRDGLVQTLLADLGKNYDPNAALKFLKVLEAEGNKEAKAIASKNLKQLLKVPPDQDTTLHVIYKTPYVLGEIVLSGKNTTKTHPLCKFYPIHFKKTYLKAMSRWETSPNHEAKQSHKIWNHFQECQKEPSDGTKSIIPLPLGSSPSTYRSQLLEAKSLGALSPVNSNADPDELSKQIIDAKKNFGSVLKLWDGIESLNKCVDTLHEGGFLHNDLHKENLLLREDNNMLEGCLIDFETSEEDSRFNTLEWAATKTNDKRYLLKEACLIFLCSETKEQTYILQSSPIAQAVIDKLSTDPLLLVIQKQIGRPISISNYNLKPKKSVGENKNKAIEIE